MQPFLIAIHVITCIILVVTVLLQQGKGAEVGAVFGSSEAIFGSAGPATLLSKITTACAIIFMLTSLSLTYLSIQNRGQSVMRNVQQVPVAPKLPVTSGLKERAGAQGGDVKVLPGTGSDGKKLNAQSVRDANKVQGKGQSASVPQHAEMSKKMPGQGTASQNAH